MKTVGRYLLSPRMLVPILAVVGACSFVTWASLHDVNFTPRIEYGPYMVGFIDASDTDIKDGDVLDVLTPTDCHPVRFRKWWFVCMTEDLPDNWRQTHPEKEWGPSWQKAKQSSSLLTAH